MQASGSLYAPVMVPYFPVPHVKLQPAWIVVAAVTFPYRPVVQLLHALETLVPPSRIPYLPVGQLVQLSNPVIAAYVPNKHFEQPIDFVCAPATVPYVPAEQFAQPSCSTMAPNWIPYLPFGHCTQLALPVAFWYWP